MSTAIRLTSTGPGTALCLLASGLLAACSGGVDSGTPVLQPGGDPLPPGVAPTPVAGPGALPTAADPGVTPPGVVPDPVADPEMIEAIQECAAGGSIEANIPRRLNRVELNNLAIDVFGSTSDAFLNNLPNDQNSKVGGSSLTVTGAFGELYEMAALEVASEYVNATNPVSTCVGGPSAQCAVDLLRPLATRMMRRPMSVELETKLGSITQVALDGGLEFDEAIQDSILGLFLFPDTLYMDTHVAPVPGVFQLDGYSIAERLALAIWSSVPDEQLLASAAAGSLASSAGLNAEITRMIADPVKGERFISGFASDFLTLDALGALADDVPEEFDSGDWAQLVADMAEESTLFLQDAFANNLPIGDFVTARHTFLNENLAEHYSLSAEYAAAGGAGDFVKVALPADSQRLGLTTQGYFMARLSHHPRIFRGKEFRLQFMCGTLPGTPDDPVIQAEIDRQLREQEGKSEEELALERETSPGCAGCHSLMDPLGKAYGAFDEAGRIAAGTDTASTYLGSALTDAVSAANFIAADDGFAPCIVSHVLGPVTNRNIETAKSPADRCIADTVAASVGENPGFRDLLVGSLNSVVFTTRVVGQ